MLAPFFVGKGGRKLTPEEVDAQRLASQAMYLKGADFSPAGHWSEAVGRAFNGWASGRVNKIAGKNEDAGMAGADAYIQNDPVLAALLGGKSTGASVMPQNASYAPPTASAPAVVADPNEVLAGDAMAALGKSTPATPEAIRAGLVARGLPEHVADGFVMNFQDESGLNPGINEINPIVPGSRGGFGLYQLTGPRRVAYEAFAADRGVDPSDVDAQLDFLMTELQGSEANAAGAILSTKTPGEAGAAIVNEFLRPSPEYAASRAAEYLGGAPYTGGGMSAGGAPIPMAGGGADVTAALAAAMSDPWVAKKYGPVLEALMGQEMKRADMQYQAQLAQSDPMYQAQLAELNAPKVSDYDARAAAATQYGLQPGTPEYQRFVLAGDVAGGTGGGAPASFQALAMQAEAGGLVPGTPEYQSFMLSGGAGNGTGDGPAAFQALHMQALAAGFPEGTPEYKEFMATRGSGLVEGARVRGEAAANAEVAAPADIAVADRTLGYIDEVRNHPGKGQGTGLSSYGNWIPGTSGKDFQNRVDQLKSGAFLSAIDEMRGMGSLSNAEGQTATAAITRMDTATSEEEFNAALADYEEIVKLGRDRAAKRLKAPAEAVAPVAITSDEEYEALPPGTMFVGPDGVTRVKP